MNNNNGYQFDLSEMTAIKKYQASENLIYAEPGCYNWNSNLSLWTKYGKYIPGGTCYSVCLGGHICGGGYGSDSRLAGLTVDYLEGVELIVVDKNKKAKVITTFKDTR